MGTGDCHDVVRSAGIRQGVATAFAHLDGAVFVFVYSAFLLPELVHDDGVDEVPLLLETLMFVAFLLVSATWMAYRFYRYYRDRTDWLGDGEEPTPERVDGVLRLPIGLAVQGLVPWIVGSVVFGGCALVLGEPVAEAVRTSTTIVLGGLVSCALAFLFTERMLRPVFALALGGVAPERARTLGVRPRLLLSWALGSGVPLAGLAVLPLKADGAGVGPAVVGLALGGLFVGLLAMVVAARSVADPLDEVRTALARVAQGDLNVRVPVDDGGEIGLLQSGVNSMVDGLRERARLADLFGRHVGAEVARRALVEGAGLDSEQREASALFVDVVGSTAMAEVLPPQEVVRTLNAFFGAVVAAVQAEGGWVNKFEGDGALCVFGAPATQPDHAARALRAAWSLRQRIEELAHAHAGLDAAVGVSSGSLVAGNVGTEQRYEYTVIGRPVNEAARLSELAKSREGRVLASAAAVERAGSEGDRWRSLGTVTLRGQQAPTAIYEPTAAAKVGVAAAP